MKRVQKSAGRTTRRTVLQAGFAVGAVPFVVPASALGRAGRAAPSERITIGFIGCGKMCNDYHIPEVLRQPDTQAVAVCEVDRTRREHAKRRVDEHYAKGSKADFKGCAEYVDFRQMIARPDIDAVVIATPDHWHAIPLIEAVKAGKDVYCEKPLTLTIGEAKRCIEAARQHRRVVQTGSQQRSNVFGSFRQAVEIIQSGRLGKVTRVTVGVGAPSVLCDLPEEPVEPGLDWDMWLGPAPLRPYNSVLSPRGVHNHFPNWRGYREYSGGLHTDMGAHHYDIANWALGLDHTGPTRIIPPESPDAQAGVRYQYPNGLEIEHGGPSGCVFFGTAGKLHIDRGVLTSEPESIVAEPLGAGDVHIVPSPGHHRNWLDCIRSGERPVADVEIGARTVSLVHLGNLAYWNHRELHWDPQAWRFADDAEANQWLDRERRDPWKLG
jgi:predicted dehydrogenase